MDWKPIVNRVVRAIDAGPAYLTGGEFIRMMQEVDPYLSGYTAFSSLISNRTVKMWSPKFEPFSAEKPRCRLQ
jgi:hypothetical protein